MEVYRSVYQFSFVTKSKDHYYYYCSDDGKDWYIDRSGDSWDNVIVRLDSEKSNWLELLLLTGKSHNWVKRMIRNSERRRRRYLKSIEIQNKEMMQRLRRFEAQRAKG